MPCSPCFPDGGEAQLVLVAARFGFMVKIRTRGRWSIWSAMYQLGEVDRPYRARPMNTTNSFTLPAKRRSRLRVLLIVIGVLLIIRVILPYVLLRLVNERLAELPGYHGHIDDLDLALIRGAYRIEHLVIDEVDTTSQERTPFVAADAIDLSVEWKALLHGAVVGELVLEAPMVIFTKDAVEPAELQQDTTTFSELLNDLMPIRVNRVEAHGGVLRYRDPTSAPVVDIQMDRMELLALNLRNKYDEGDLLPSTLRMDANVYGGTMALRMKLNPLAEKPTFDLNAELEKLELIKLNDFMQAYGRFDVNSGELGLYTELAAKEGGFTGYVKPIIKDLDVVGKEDRNDGVFRKLWEVVVGGVGGLFKNPREEQVATKVRFSGRMDGPRTNVLYAIVDLVRNAFIQALQPAVDQQINITSVDAPEPKKEGFIKRLFTDENK